MSQMRVRDVMTTALVAAHPDDSFKQAYRLMRRAHVSGLPVIDAQGTLIGMVTEADLLRHSDSHDRRGVSVRDIMSVKLITATGEDTVHDAIGVLLAGGVRRLPVVDAERHLVGIVSRRDLLRSIGKRDQQIAEEVAGDVLNGPLTDDAADVQVSVRDGVVRLQGTVDAATTKALLTNVILSIDGVVGVENNVRIAGDGL